MVPGLVGTFVLPLKRSGFDSLDVRLSVCNGIHGLVLLVILIIGRKFENQPALSLLPQLDIYYK
jgi:hypothetical protein